MTFVQSLYLILGIAVVTSPTILLCSLGITSLLGIRLGETTISRLTQAAVLFGLLPALAILFLMILTGDRFVPVDLGDWVSLESEQHEHFQFHLKLIFDRLSVPFAILSFVLCGVIGAFTRRYLHRETGYNRFFIFFALFMTGMVVSSVAGTIETLFFGWELVGLSSALLVAYFHERELPVQNGQRVWSVYRLSDASFLIAALSMHHLTGQGDFQSFVGALPWPEGRAEISQSHALIVGSLLLLAAAGKSALIPFSGWLPRAMEGPTPSSAVFYGSLSVHLGAYLLLRVSPLLEASQTLQYIVVLFGAISALCGAMMSRVQSDVKSSLAYASLTQVGIIVVEIGLGFYYLALIHIVGHAALRTLQLLRAPTLLTDYHAIENALGRRLDHESKGWVRFLPHSAQRWAYRFSLERGFMDVSIDRFLVEPFMFALRWSNQQELRWTNWLSGDKTNTSRNVEELES